MKLIVGLGNPGPKYELTRHNIGFIIIDLYAHSLNIKFSEGKGDWFEATGIYSKEEIFLLRPMTFMNNSGLAVREFVEKLEIDLKDVLVIVDDFQIPLGMIRVRKNGSDGGHNGLADIIYHLNSDEFARMRVGIGKDEILKKDEFIDFVLGVFENEEIEVIKKLMPVYFDCINSFITDGIAKTMNTYNKMHIIQ